MSEEMSTYYRMLGITEDAGYDEITEKAEFLSEAYSDDPARLGKIEEAKQKILDDLLRKRLSGELKSEVADSPFDAKPIERTPPWVIAKELADKLFEIPTPKFALKVVGLIMGLTAAAWISPNSAGTILLINVMSGMGFMYNRGEPDVPRDDFGQVGEIRPMKPKPMALTCGVTFVLWMWGYLKAKRLIALAIFPPAFETILRTTFISAALTVAALFVKVQKVFD